MSPAQKVIWAYVLKKHAQAFQALADSRYEAPLLGDAELLGCRLEAKTGGSNPPNVGSSPTAPAIYVDDATG